MLADPKFAVPKYSGTNANPSYVLFEQYSGGTWTGPNDQTSAVQIVYDADNVYFGFVVTDDYHEKSHFTTTRWAATKTAKASLWPIRIWPIRLWSITRQARIVPWMAVVQHQPSLNAILLTREPLTK